ncbi:hypothetical protein P152DRAFT_453174 [Eremomyces bilateralis CBS 781.70]|uniref:Capsid protein n=1 Tax=Eremomyces bilateralis CBS 781.70 TaxID=1392243 RepID=A0A6G1FQD7_9PEZI|nr:uncharacterized protein P152DRAFT_453174 [Eremomyces bilateralis CBS 781.70]KAF1808045.1 hypothetical protein P152DRAFT_453174 [Eremomyces bilateralis CBS 781.70]
MVARYSSSRKGYGRKPYKKRMPLKKRSGKKTIGKAVVSRVVQRAVKDEVARLAKGPPQKVILRGHPDKVILCSEGPQAAESYFRVPITQVIPVQRSMNSGPDSCWRRTDKVHIKGVGVRLKLTFATSVQVMGVCYPARVQEKLVETDGGGGDIPTTFRVGFEDQTAKRVRLLRVEETNFLRVAKDGPFSVIPGPKGSIMFDSTDHSLFNCRLADGPGQPVGEARWKVGEDEKRKSGRTFAQEYHVSGIMRTQNWAPNTPGGYVQYDTRDIQVYWALDKKMEFATSEGNLPVFEPNLELMFGVRALGAILPKDGNRGMGPLEYGWLSNLMLDVYYS